MEAIASSMGLLAAASTALGWAQRRERAARSVRRRLSLDAVRQGIALMTVMQQHRGMAAALLNGDTGFAGRLADKQREVDSTLSALCAGFARAPGLAASGRRLDAIRTAWT